MQKLIKLREILSFFVHATKYSFLLHRFTLCLAPVLTKTKSYSAHITISNILSMANCNATIEKLHELPAETSHHVIPHGVAYFPKLPFTVLMGHFLHTPIGDSDYSLLLVLFWCDSHDLWSVD